LALRHQLHVLRRQRPGRLRLFTFDRLLWVLLYRLWPRCLEVMVYRVPKAFRGNAIEITDPKSALLDCLAQPAGYGSVFLDRNCRVALRTQSVQEGLAMRPRLARLISSFTARIPRDCHVPLLSCWRKARPLVSGDQIVSESERLRSSHPGSIGGATPRVGSGRQRRQPSR
jgi:hypothetical protein